MEFFSIYQIEFLLYVGISIFAIATENSDQRTSREVFFYWLIGSAMLVFFVDFLDGFIENGGDKGFLMRLVSLLLPYPLLRQFTRRARDAGRGKQLAYWAIVPIVNFVPTLTLLFIEGKPSPINYRVTDT